MKNRRLKSINVFFDINQSSLKDIENIPNFKELVYGELYKAVKEAKDSNKEITPLFEVNNSGYIIELSKDAWVPALEKAISHYERKEEFETCALIKSLIEQIYEQRNKLNTRNSQQSFKRKNPIKKKKSKKGNPRKATIR